MLRMLQRLKGYESIDSVVVLDVDSVIDYVINCFLYDLREGKGATA